MSLFFSLTFKVKQGNSCFTSASADSLTFTLTAQTFLDPVANRWLSLQFSSRYLCKARLGMEEGYEACVRLRFLDRAFFSFYSWKKKKVSLQMGCCLNLFTSVVVVVCAWTCQFCVLSLRQWWLAVSLSIQMSAPNKQTLNWTSCLWIMMCGLSL